jgi:hypothetical protein
VALALKLQHRAAVHQPVKYRADHRHIPSILVSGLAIAQFLTTPDKWRNARLDPVSTSNVSRAAARPDPVSSGIIKKFDKYLFLHLEQHIANERKRFNGCF